MDAAHCLAPRSFSQGQYVASQFLFFLIVNHTIPMANTKLIGSLVACSQDDSFDLLLLGLRQLPFYIN